MLRFFHSASEDLESAPVSSHKRAFAPSRAENGSNKCHIKIKTRKQHFGKNCPENFWGDFVHVFFLPSKGDDAKKQ